MKIFKQLILLALVCLVYSCTQFEDRSSSDVTEVTKNIDGTWKIIRVMRNGSDITTLMDFSKFRISFQDNHTYTIDNYLPFLVKSDGTWNLDDPQYPFNLVFKEKTSGESLISGFNYPVVNGKRQLSLSFSPGCYNNIYTYVFEKVSN
jgi:hypothetical protein